MREGWVVYGRSWQREDRSPLFINEYHGGYYVESMRHGDRRDERYRHTTLEQAMLVVETMDLLNEDLPE